MDTGDTAWLLMSTALVMIMLGAVSIASAVYVIVDLDTPLTGPIVSSSQPMRDALAHLDRPL